MIVVFNQQKNELGRILTVVRIALALGWRKKLECEGEAGLYRLLGGRLVRMEISVPTGVNLPN